MRRVTLAKLFYIIYKLSVVLDTAFSSSYEVMALISMASITDIALRWNLTFQSLRGSLVISVCTVG